MSFVTTVSLEYNIEYGSEVFGISQIACVQEIETVLPLVSKSNLMLTTMCIHELAIQGLNQVNMRDWGVCQ